MSLQTLKQWVQESNRIVFFGGAGVSTESGIPDFRSTDGLYNQVYPYPPERILSRSFFETDVDYFYRFYRDKMMPIDYLPNITHYKLAQWEAEGKLSAVITQNIDGLHQKAGSQNILELHGSVYRNYCMTCGKHYSAAYIKESSGVPLCSCGGVIKPDVVLYEESLNSDVMQESIFQIRQADMLIVAGTSLRVYPAAGLIEHYTGERLVLLNRDATPYDSVADLVINDSLGDIFSKL